MKSETEKQFRRRVISYKIIYVPIIITLLGLVGYWLKSKNETAASIQVNPNQTQTTNVTVNVPKDTIKKQDVNQNGSSKTLDSKRVENKNQIINNAPNQGVQINENNGTVVVPSLLPRKFTSNDAKKLLKNYSLDYPIELWMKGTTKESRQFFDQVAASISELGYNNISQNIIGMYVGEDHQENFVVQKQNGKVIISIYPQDK